MKKFYFSIIFSLLGSVLFAQSMEKGNFLFDVGGGFGTYYAVLTDEDDDVIDEDGAAPVYIDVNARYALSKRFAVGLNMDFGSYVSEDPGTYTYTKVCASFRYVPLNKEIFQIFTDANLGINALSYSEGFIDNAIGLHAQVNAGLNLYFGENSPVGYYLMGGFSTYTLNSTFENSTTEYRWYFIGANLQMGATFRF